MCTTKTRRRGRLSRTFNWGVFLQFVRDLTVDFTTAPAIAAAGTRLYNYLEGGGKLRYFTMRRDRIQRVLHFTRAHRAVAGEELGGTHG